MNYWPSEVTNLSELNEPLFRLIKEVSDTGKETAKIMYGANGWVLHHNTDIWRITGAVDKAPSGMWPSGGAWLCRHLWERYLYTGDVEFLRSVYPILKESGRFFDEIMVKEPVHNWLVSAPVIHRRMYIREVTGKLLQLPDAPWTTNDFRSLDSNYICFSNTGYRPEVCLSSDTTSQRNGSHAGGTLGAITRVDVRLDDPKDVHRHISHLYGLFPSNQISPYRTPELFDAARTSLIHRGDRRPGGAWDGKFAFGHACLMATTPTS